MNRLFYMILITLACLVLACENDRQQFDPTVCAMNIAVKDTIYSFAIKPSTVSMDTVPFYISLIGEARDYPRNFQLRATENSELSPEHYQLPALVLEANRVNDTLNLVFVKKPDLADTTFLLELEFVAGDHFSAGVNRKIRIHVGDKLVKPGNWEEKLEIHFGVYSEVKHSLIIDATGVYDYSGLGLGTLKNLALMTKNYLAELNAERQQEGKGQLEDEFGRIIVIGSN